MTEINRQPQGVPSGGQFAASTHGEPDVTLTPAARRPELDGWPDTLPEPTLDFSINEDGGIVTTLTAGDSGPMEIFTDNDSTGRCDYTRYAGAWEVDEDELDGAFEWAAEKHLDIERSIRAESRKAADAARHRILADATGAPAAVSDEQLIELLDAATPAHQEAAKTIEMTSTALASRKILTDHPEATHLSLDWGGDGDREEIYLDRAYALNSSGKVLGKYSQGSVFKDEHTFVFDHLKNLSTDVDSAHWSKFSKRAVDGFNKATDQKDASTINLKAAAAWAPGGQ